MIFFHMCTHSSVQSAMRFTYSPGRFCRDDDTDNVFTYLRSALRAETSSFVTSMTTMMTVMTRMAMTTITAMFCTCLRCALRVDPSGSGRGGIVKPWWGSEGAVSWKTWQGWWWLEWCDGESNDYYDCDNRTRTEESCVKKIATWAESRSTIQTSSGTLRNANLLHDDD